MAALAALAALPAPARAEKNVSEEEGAAEPERPEGAPEPLRMTESAAPAKTPGVERGPYVALGFAGGISSLNPGSSVVLRLEGVGHFAQLFGVGSGHWSGGIYGLVAIPGSGGVHGLTAMEVSYILAGGLFEPGVVAGVTFFPGFTTYDFGFGGGPKLASEIKLWDPLALTAEVVPVFSSFSGNSFELFAVAGLKLMLPRF